jgi:site-specific DNA recombinase
VCGSSIDQYRQRGSSHLSRPVTLLAPDIVEAILEGRQPKRLELKTLLKPLPLSLDLQRRQLGFA